MSCGMAPLDLDTLVISCDGGGDGAELKAARGCETALSDSDADADADAEERDEDPYAPAQSLRLRIGEDIEWSDVGAVAVLERDDSTKGAGANPKCAARRTAAAPRSSVSAPAPRAAVAVVIGGLQSAAGKAAREHGRLRSPRRLGGRARVFAAGEAAAAADALAEPGSPKVSCLGGVRSQPRAAAEGAGSGRRWWAWIVAGVVSCCWNGRRERRRPRGSDEAD